MSLVGFKGMNHPQQTGRRGARPDVDDRGTEPAFFDMLNRRFGFTIDAAAQAHNAKLPRYFTPEQDGLARPWTGERVWCNPPYSDIEPWAQKARLEAAELVVLLLPANRTEQGWWQRQVEPFRRTGACQVEFLPGRMRFVAPGARKIGADERPPFGCCLVIWGEERAQCGCYLGGKFNQGRCVCGDPPAGKGRP